MWRVCLSRYRQCCNPGRFWGNRHQFLGCRILSLACRRAAVSSNSSSPTLGSQTRRISDRCNVENTFCVCREGACAKSTLARNLFSPDCKHEPSLRRGEKNQQFQRPRRWLDAQVFGCHRRVAGSQLKLGAPAFLPSKSLAPPIQSENAGGVDWPLALSFRDTSNIKRPKVPSDWLERNKKFGSVIVHTTLVTTLSSFSILAIAQSHLQTQFHILPPPHQKKKTSSTHRNVEIT